MAFITNRFGFILAIAALGLLLPASAQALVFNVSSSVGWASTGVTVSVGQTLNITATGLITFDSAGRQADPDGMPDGDPAGFSAYLVPTLAGQTLVGRIGSSGSLADLSGFLLGSSFSQVVSTSGTLFLGFNDGFVNSARTGLNGGGVADNRGSFTANISVENASIPETGTLALLGIGIAGLGMMARRRRR